MKIDVYNRSGEVVDKTNMRDDVFKVPLNQALLHQALVMYQANQRQGTHSTKTRAEVAGGGRKPWRQKGTGRARQGSIRSPQWRTGGIAFGPKPRDYRKVMPKKMRRLAIRCALSSLVTSKRLVVLQDLDIEQPKTKEMVAILQALGIEQSALIVTTGRNLALNRATRNIARTKVLMADLLNVLDLLKYTKVVMTVDAIRRAEGLWSADKSNESAETQSIPTKGVGVNKVASDPDKPAKLKGESQASENPTDET